MVVKSQINDFETQNLVPKIHKIKIFRGAYSAPPDPLADGEGLAAPPQETEKLYRVARIRHHFTFESLCIEKRKCVDSALSALKNIDQKC